MLNQNITTADYEKTQVKIKLMSELNMGRKSGEEKGWVLYEDVKAHFEGKGL